MQSIRKTKSAKQKKDELYQFIMEEGRQALKPCDYCVRNGHECKMATEKSGKCGQCAKGDGRQKCNAIPCEIFFFLMFLFKVDFRKIGDRMHRELEKLRQELREAQQEVFDKAERIAKLAAEQSAGSAKVMRLQQQLDHFESAFRRRLDEETAILDQEVEDSGPGPVELVEGLELDGSFPLLTESQQQELMDFNFDFESVMGGPSS